MSVHNTRKPVHMEMIGGKSKRQHMWEAIRAKREGFTIQDVAATTDLSMEAVKSYVTALKRGKWLAQINDTRTRGVMKRYVLVRDNGIEAPRITLQGQLVTQGLVQEQLWRTMRLIGEFDHRQLAAQASTPSHPVSLSATRDYLRHLAHAGYIRRVSGNRQGQLIRWAFNHTHYTGPRPPIVQRTQSVYDPNLGKVVWQEEVNDDDL